MQRTTDDRALRAHSITQELARYRGKRGFSLLFINTQSNHSILPLFSGYELDPDLTVAAADRRTWCVVGRQSQGSAGFVAVWCDWPRSMLHKTTGELQPPQPPADGKQPLGRGKPSELSVRGSIARAQSLVGPCETLCVLMVWDIPSASQLPEAGVMFYIEKLRVSSPGIHPELWHASQLQYPVPSHCKSVPHAIATPEETAEFPDPSVLPLLLESDPAVRWLGARRGTIIKITRLDSRSGVEVLFRRVVSSQPPK